MGIFPAPFFIAKKIKILRNMYLTYYAICAIL
nr:MAG TPA: hypothetical protein [Caudoviricetes sp.]